MNNTIRCSEFYTNTNPKTRHIRHIRLQGDHNNNKMERFNADVRDRENNEGIKESRYTYFSWLSNIS